MRRATTILLLLASILSFSQTPELTIQLGHSKLIYDVAYSPDGKYAASASADRTVKIWELDQGREVRTIYIDEGYATSVQFSNDSRDLLVGGGSYDIGILKIYDLETGNVIADMKGHTEYAWNAGYSIDGSIVYSTSFDQTVKMWDAATGALLKSTETLPGLMRQLSVDPRGEYIVTTCDEEEFGATLWSARDLSFVRKLETGKPLFDARTVAFSGDGSYIVVGDFSSDVAVFKREASTPEYIIAAHNNLIRCVTTDNQGNTFFTGSDDKMIYQWDMKTGDYIGSYSGHKDYVYALDVHPDNGLLLSGGSFDKSLKEWDIQKHRLIRSFSGNVYPVRDLELYDDGNRLAILSYDRFGGDAYTWRLDRMNSMENLGAIDEHYSYMDVTEDALLIAGSSGNIKIFDNKTQQERSEHYLWTEIRDPIFHPDGDRLLMGIKDETDGPAWNAYSGIHQFNLKSGETKPFTSELDRLPGDQYIRYNDAGTAFYVQESNYDELRVNRYIDSSGVLDWSISDTNHVLGFTAYSPGEDKLLLLDGRDVVLYDMKTQEHLWTGEDILFSSAAAVHFISNDMAIISGGDWSEGFVALFDLNTRKIIRSKTDFTSAQQTVTFDPKRKLIISGGDDARITFLDTKTLEVQLTLFAFSEARGEWAAVHPSGLFDGSKEAIEKHLYFTYRLEPIELFQLKERYYEPGLIQKVLGYYSEPLRDVGKFVEVNLYPKARLQLDKNTLRVSLLKRTGGIGKVSFLINGKEMLEDISSLLKAEVESPSEGGIKTRDKELPFVDIDLEKFTRFMIPGQNNQLEIITYNVDNSLSSPVYHVNYAAPAHSGFGALVERPTLHAVVIGTSDYRGESLDLNYASKDAEDMANALKTGGAELFGEDHVNIRLLHSNAEDPVLQPTKENIAAVMKEIATAARPEDVLILYFSGHGVTYGDQNTQFHYLTKDIESGDISDPVIRNSYTISTNDMTNWLNAIPAQKQIMILDACASGQAVEDLLAMDKNVSSSQIKALDKMKDRTGLFIIAGSAANKVSFEASQFGQSLLTYSLLSGMNVISGKREDRMVDLVDWLNYSKERVPDLAGTIGGIQEPVVALPRNLNSFDIAHISDENMIVVADIKPVFVRSTLMEMNEMDDVLSLADKLDHYFQDMAAKGRSSQIVFVDVKKFPSAYSIKGFYEVSGDMVDINATLRKGGEKLGLISVSGPSNDPDGLVEKVIDQLNGLIRE